MVIEERDDDIMIVIEDSGVFALGDYPLGHIRTLYLECEGDVGAVAERLEADGWTPADIVAGVAR